MWMIELPWPEHSRFPSWVGVVRRSDLDGQVALAEKQGVRIMEKTLATQVSEDGLLTGVTLAHNGAGRRSPTSKRPSSWLFAPITTWRSKKAASLLALLRR